MSPSVWQCGAPGRHRLYRSSHVSFQGTGASSIFSILHICRPGRLPAFSNSLWWSPMTESGQVQMWWETDSVVLWSDSTESITAVCRCLHWHFKWVCSGTPEVVNTQREREREREEHKKILSNICAIVLLHLPNAALIKRYRLWWKLN